MINYLKFSDSFMYSCKLSVRTSKFLAVNPIMVSGHRNRSELTVTVSKRLNSL